MSKDSEKEKKESSTDLSNIVKSARSYLEESSTTTNTIPIQGILRKSENPITLILLPVNRSVAVADYALEIKLSDIAKYEFVNESVEGEKIMQVFVPYDSTVNIISRVKVSNLMQFFSNTTRNIPAANRREEGRFFPSIARYPKQPERKEYYSSFQFPYNQPQELPRWDKFGIDDQPNPPKSPLEDIKAGYSDPKSYYDPAPDMENYYQSYRPSKPYLDQGQGDPQKVAYGDPPKLPTYDTPNPPIKEGHWDAPKTSYYDPAPDMENYYQSYRPSKPYLDQGQGDPQKVAYGDPPKLPTYDTPFILANPHVAPNVEKYYEFNFPKPRVTGKRPWEVKQPHWDIPRHTW